MTKDIFDLWSQPTKQMKKKIARAKKRKTLLVGIVLVSVTGLALAGVRIWKSAPATKTLPSVATAWIRNPRFLNPPLELDTGVILDQIYERAPNDGNWCWGIRGYTWSEGRIYPIGEYEFVSHKTRDSSYSVKICIKDSSNRWGVGSLVQGWVWGDTLPALWHVPDSLVVENRRITVYFRANPKDYGACLDTANNAVNYMVDIWLTDNSSSYKIVLDLYFHRTVPLYDPHMDDSGIYHYPADVTFIGKSVWGEVTVDIDHHINKAILAAKTDGYTFNKNQIMLCQAEILVEIRNAWACLLVDCFGLYWS